MPLWIRFDGLEAGGQRGSDVYINHAAPVTTDMRFDRTDLLGRDGQMAGSDLISKRVWDLTLHTNQHNEDDAVAFAKAWEMAWRNPDIRDGTKKVPLEYSRDQINWFRVFGRPTLFTGPELDVFTVQGRGVLDLQFEQLDPLHYSSETESVALEIAPRVTGGMRVPVRFPIRFNRTGAPTDRWRDNSGEAPTPVTLRFYGPVTDPVATVQGQWRFAVKGSLAWDEYLEIDPVAATVMVYSETGAEARPAFSMIRTGSRLSDLVLPPGRHSFSFTGIDPTFTASMVAAWPHAYSSIQ